jgi:hypothetical protein
MLQQVQEAQMKALPNLWSRLATLRAVARQKSSEYKIIPTDRMNVSDKAIPTIRTSRALISLLVYFFMVWLLL